MSDMEGEGVPGETSSVFRSRPELWAYKEEEVKQCRLLWGTET